MTPSTNLREEIEAILKKYSEDDFGMEPGCSWTDYDWEKIMPELLAIITRERKAAVEEATQLLVKHRDAFDWSILAAEAPEGYEVAIERMKDIQFCMFSQGSL